MLYNLLTTIDGETSSTVIDSSNPMDGSSVLESSSVVSEDISTSTPADDTSSTVTSEDASISTSDSTQGTTTETSSSEQLPGGCFDKENLPGTLGMLGVIVGLCALYYFVNKRGMKKRQEYIDRRNNIQPGNKVMTIGGITGTVVEVCPEDNTFVLETGNEANGKSYLRFDKAAIHTTDVEMEPAQPIAPVEEMPVNEQEDELFDENNKPEPVEEPATENAETIETETADEE